MSGGSHINRTYGSRAAKSIYMWQTLDVEGEKFYVPLDNGLNPIGKLALKEVRAEGEEGSPAIISLVLVSVDHVTGDAGVGTQSLRRLITRALESILSDDDATTHEIYEALIMRLAPSNLAASVPQDGLDVEQILRDNFWCYEVPVSGGGMARKWTWHKEKAEKEGCRS